MNLRTTLGCSALVVALLTLGWARQQRTELNQLRMDVAALQSAVAAPPSQPGPAPTVPPEEHPSLELLRLRNEVGQLQRQVDELLPARSENEKLRTELAAQKSNANGRSDLPSGYIRKSEAKFCGFGSPEHTLQSFFWAIQHHDAKTLLKSFDPAAETRIEKQLREQGSEEFFKDTKIIPGYLIVSRTQNQDGSVELLVAFDPDDERSAQKLTFRMFNGEWRQVGGM